MAQSKAKTVEQYLIELPADRRGAICAVRQVILDNLPKGYEEVMQYGMISYVIPLNKYPNTYNKKALAVTSLASQKNYMALYLMCMAEKETEKWFRDKYKENGKKLDMGKSCVRFKKFEDLPLDLIGETIVHTPVKKFISLYEKAMKR
jgi:hypothetical protein